MANRFDWNALEEKIKAAMSDYDDIDKRSKSLAVISISVMMDISIEEAIDSLTDGGNDRGVDALYIDNRENHNDIHIIQSKCVEIFERSKKNYPGGEVDKVTSFISDLTSEDMEALKNVNDHLSRKIRDAIQAQRNTNATITVHFVGNMAALPQQDMDRIQSTFQRYAAVTFQMHDLDSLSDFFLAKRAPLIDREVTAIDQNFFDRTDLGLRGMVCTVEATNIVEAIRSKADPDNIEMGIFDQNVRVYLRKYNRINKRIIESALSDENHMFWYQNNGITITCDKIEMAPTRRAPIIKLSNMQIVNGGQTSNCLFEAAKENPSKLNDVVVLVRIIETSSEDIKLSIAEATNSQTPINARDLRANDRQQRQIEMEFESLGYYYERKVNQFGEKPKNERIDALEAAQAYLAFGLGMPEVAKKDRGRIFGDLYDTVFSDELTVDKLLTSYKLMKRINERKSELRKKLRHKEDIEKGSLALIDGAFHVVFTIRQIMSERGGSFWGIDMANSDIEEAIEVVQKLYIREEEVNESFSSNQFFKDSQTKDKIIKAVGARYQEAPTIERT